MAIGYEGLAKIKVGTTEDLVLCTGASVPDSRVRLDSASAYGGKIKTPVSEIAIGAPHNYDWSVQDGSLNFELTTDVITNQIKPWILDRQKAAQVTLQSRNSNVQRFDKCYWSSITIGATENALAEGSIAFTAIQLDSYTQGGNYAENKIGNGYLCNPGSLNVPDPLDAVIPFWKTYVNMDSVLVPFTTWSIVYSQEVVKFFSCENNANPIAPKYLAVGPMTITFTGDYMFVETSPWNVPDSVSSMLVNIDTESLSYDTLEKTSDTDAVAGMNDMTPIAVEYMIYGIS